MERKSVGIVLFPEVEVLDFCGPFEVFSATRLQEERRREDPSPFAVRLVAESNAVIETVGGMKVLPDCTFQSCPRLDILVVPGGWGTRKEIANPCTARLAQGARGRGRDAGLGLHRLHASGIRRTARGTAGHHALARARLDAPVAAAVRVIGDRRVVEDGDIMTSAGISAGIDLALKIVARYCGEDIARATARHMEYSFPEDLFLSIAEP